MPPTQNQPSGVPMGTMMPQQPQPTPATQAPANKIGITLAALVVLALLGFGGYYLYTNGALSLPGSASPSDIENARDEKTEALSQPQSDSDDLGSIEADLNATDVSGLDEESASIDSALKAQ